MLGVVVSFNFLIYPSTLFFLETLHSHQLCLGQNIFNVGKHRTSCKLGAPLIGYPTTNSDLHAEFGSPTFFAHYNFRKFCTMRLHSL
jgi:hypothetical protein